MKLNRPISHRLYSRNVFAGLVAGSVAFAGVAQAQRAGTLVLGGFGQYTGVLGGFGQYTGFDSSVKPGGQTGIDITNGWGWGGHVGAFVARNLEVETEGSYTERTRPSGETVKYGPVAARLLYTPTIGRFDGGRANLIVGAGGVLAPYHSDQLPALYTYGYGASGDLGLRVLLDQGVAIRTDAVADYHPTGISSTNYRFQAGVELMPNLHVSNGGKPLTAGSKSGWLALPDTGRRDMDKGVTEIHGFGQYTYYGSKLDFDRGTSALGAGAGVGVFVLPQVEVEGEGSYTAPKTDASSAVGQGVGYDDGRFALRGNYNIPVGVTQVILGAGAVRQSFHRSDNLAGPNSSYTFGPSGLVGLRVPVTQGVVLRADGIVDYLPGDFKTTNLTGRVGVSFLLGERKRTDQRHKEAEITEPALPAEYKVPAGSGPDERPRPLIMFDTVAVRTPIFFDFDRADLTDDAKTVLDAKVKAFTLRPTMRIRIEGNTDERGSGRYNLALGQRRAEAAREYLVQHGVDQDKIDIVSKGKSDNTVQYNSGCTAQTEECWRTKRRDSFIITAM